MEGLQGVGDGAGSLGVVVSASWMEGVGNVCTTAETLVNHILQRQVGTVGETAVGGDAPLRSVHFPASSINSSA